MSCAAGRRWTTITNGAGHGFSFLVSRISRRSGKGAWQMSAAARRAFVCAPDALPFVRPTG